MYFNFVFCRAPVYAEPLKSGRFDIGNLQSYIECDQYFTAGMHMHMHCDDITLYGVLHSSPFRSLSLERVWYRVSQKSKLISQVIDVFQ
jgi:hypothetical protein